MTATTITATGTATDTATGDTDGGPFGWGHARFRLRDLEGRDRALALGLFALVLIPFVVALVRAFHDGWVPSGDEANIATRSWDVLSRHPPLTGLPSTTSLYGAQIVTNHPGPIEFYLIAIPLRVLGITAGPLLTAAAINAAFALIVVYAFFRRLGLNAMLWAGVLVLAVIASAGSAVLVDTLSSNMTMYAILATTVLAWALVDGDLRLLPLTALVASYAAQQHLAAGLIVMPLIVVAVVALAVQLVKRVRAGALTITPETRRFAAAAFVIGAVCWAPVAVDQVKDHPGNLTEIIKFARDNTRATIGMKDGVYQALRAVGPPTILARTNTYGLFLITPLGPFRWFFSSLVVLALIALALWSRTRARSVSRLAFVGLVLLAAGVFNGSNIPASVESWRINLYRWTWTAALVVWAALGMGVVAIATRVIGDRPALRRSARLAPIAFVVVAAIITGTIAFGGASSDDHNREQPAFALEKKIDAAIVAQISRSQPVFVTSIGTAANGSIAPSVILALVRAGVHVEVAPPLVSAYGRRRRYVPGDGAAALVVVSGGATLPPEPGRVIAHAAFSPEYTRLVDQLTAFGRGRQVVLAPGAAATLARRYPGLQGLYIKELLSKLATDPRFVVTTPAFLQFVSDGLIQSPAFDQTKVKRLLELPEGENTLEHDELVSIHYLTPAQVTHATLPGL